MEFSISAYQPQLADNFYPMAASGPNLSADQKNVFLCQLLSTIDMSALGSLYFHQLRQHVALTHLNLSQAGRHLTYGRLSPDTPAENTIYLPLNSRVMQHSEPNIQYVFAAQPSREEKQCVAELHVLFCHQFTNALEFERLKKMATKDGLTGLSNRNAFNESCQRLIGRAIRHDENFGLLIIDLDNFKQVNDSCGHQEGDKVLLTVARHIARALRTEDEAFRIGGDEFCCLLGCREKQSLRHIADRISKRIAENDYLRRHGISCSIGGAVFRCDDDMHGLFERADKAMYKVKRSGKNSYLAA